VRLVRDDAANLRAHHELGSVDVVLVHFLTTYVDVPTLIADAAAVLRPGGWLSLVATTYDAFPLIQSLASAALGAAELRRLNPAPEGAGELVDALERAGLQRVEQETFEADVTFASLGALLEWGRDSGFFTHILDGLPPAVLDDAAGLESLFPLTDSYRATALLARRGARG
jgi:SAM-dependent methyltransferase